MSQAKRRMGFVIQTTHHMGLVAPCIYLFSDTSSLLTCSDIMAMSNVYKVSKCVLSISPLTLSWTGWLPLPLDHSLNGTVEDEKPPGMMSAGKRFNQMCVLGMSHWEQGGERLTESGDDADKRW